MRESCTGGRMFGKHCMGAKLMNQHIHHYLFLLTILLFLFSHCSESPFEPYNPPPSTWETITNPDSVGWSSDRLRVAFDFWEAHQTSAFMVIYDRKVLCEWGDVARKITIQSCRKSFLSALYGIHVDNGNIDISKNLEDLGIDDMPPSLTDTEKTATVRMLLQSRSGIYHPAAAESESMKRNRPQRGSHAPGTFFWYNNWDFNALGTIFEQETDTEIYEEFKRRIADPIGMQDFSVSDGDYYYEFVSIHPAYHFDMTTRDMARFGLLFLQKGRWGTEQIISEEWIEESTRPYSDVGSQGGYGYMWCTVFQGDLIPHVPLEDGAFTARGGNGHYILVLPLHNLVIVHRADPDRNEGIMHEDFGLLVKMIIEAKTE